MPADEPWQTTLTGEPVDDEESGTTPALEDDDAGLSMPECCIEGCGTPVPGITDGYESSQRGGVVCLNCWNYHDRHLHWPDREPRTGTCAECLIDEGAQRHNCDASPVDSVILFPGDECPECGAVPFETRGGGGDA